MGFPYQSGYDVSCISDGIFPDINLGLSHAHTCAHTHANMPRYTNVYYTHIKIEKEKITMLNSDVGFPSV